MSEGKSISDFEIEKYFDGDLTKDARLAFEGRMASDVLFARSVREHKALRDELYLIGQRNDFRGEMEAIHEAELGAVPDTPPLKIVKAAKPEKPPKIRKGISRTQFYIGVGIAASLAIMITVGGIQFFGSDALTEASSDAGYQDLVQDETKEATPQALVDMTEDKSEVTPVPKVRRATAFAISQDGFFVTNNHVVSGAQTVRLTFQDDQKQWVKYKAEVVYTDISADLALLQITDSAFTRLGILPFTFSRKELTIGQEVFSLGYPKDDVVFGDGTISSLTGLNGDTTAYQVSVPLNKGNSGCPIFNRYGEVVAIVKGKQNGLEGTAFAVKSSYMVALIEGYEKQLGRRLKTPRYNQIKSKSRTRQIKHISGFVYRVEAE